MKKIFAIAFFISAMCGFVFAKERIPELDKVKKIKLLESTQEDVRKLFSKNKDDIEDDDDSAMISTENALIRITFAEGGCEEDSFWNVSQGIVTSILIIPNKDIELKKFDFNFSGFRKENIDEESPEDFDYHNENSGVLFKIYDGDIYRIFFYPPKSKAGFLCANESTADYFFGQETLVETVFQDYHIDINSPAEVTELILSETEIVVGCRNSKDTSKSCPAGKSEVSVKTVAIDPENDVLTYEYTISSGKIVGKGANVVWDLSDAKPGTYTITAGANDGCGICGTTVTKTVVVKECPDCSTKDN